MSAASLFMGIWNHNAFDNFMVTRLFKAGTNGSDSASETRSESLEETRCFSPVGYLRGCMPSLTQWFARWFCKCCRPNRREKILALGREKLFEETSIFKMI